MSLFLETIRIENGRVMHIDYHRERMTRSFDYAGIIPGKWFRENFIPGNLIPESGLHKCRIIYNREIISLEITPYVQKSIRSLKIVESARLDYELKYADRSAINMLFEKRGECDDILIVCEKKITDTSYCNVALEREGLWYTPVSPLLKGTMRAFLLERGLIREDEILLQQLSHFKSVRLFNAMIPWERACTIEISGISF